MKKLLAIGDGKMFKLANKKSAALYALNSKKKGIATYTSVKSGRTFTRSVHDKVYPWEA